jgi:hypothetical protein
MIDVSHVAAGGVCSMQPRNCTRLGNVHLREKFWKNARSPHLLSLIFEAGIERASDRTAIAHIWSTATQCQHHLLKTFTQNYTDSSGDYAQKVGTVFRGCESRPDRTGLPTKCLRNIGVKAKECL